MPVEQSIGTNPQIAGPFRKYTSMTIRELVAFAQWYPVVPTQWFSLSFLPVSNRCAVLTFSYCIIYR